MGIELNKDVVQIVKNINQYSEEELSILTTVTDSKLKQREDEREQYQTQIREAKAINKTFTLEEANYRALALFFLFFLLSFFIFLVVRLSV